MEKWKPAIKFKGNDYTGLYEVSNLGRVKSIIRKGVCHERIISQQLDRGYCTVHLCKNGKEKRETVHSLVCNAFHNNTENKREVNHINGIKTDNRASNLEWNTTSENQIHAFKHGLQVSSKGEKHGRSRLKEKDIIDIRNSKEAKASLAIKYKVNIRTIFSIRARKLWSHI